MNTRRLIEIIEQTTIQLQDNSDFISINNINSVRATPIEAMFDKNIDRIDIDVYFYIIGVYKDIAESLKTELIDILGNYPDELNLDGKLNFIEFSSKIGSYDAALKLFALGKAVGLWDIIIPNNVQTSNSDLSRSIGLKKYLLN